MGFQDDLLRRLTGQSRDYLVECACGSKFLSSEAPGTICPKCLDRMDREAAEQQLAARVAAAKLPLTCREGHGMQATSRLAGKRAKCPGCSGAVEVPPLSDARWVAEVLAEELEFLSPRDSATDPVAFRRLVDLGPAALDAILRRIGGGAYLTLALGRIRDPRCFDVLVAEAASGQWEREEAAAQALGLLGDVRAIPVLNGLLARQICEVRRAAEVALGCIERQAAVRDRIERYGPDSKREHTAGEASDPVVLRDLACDPRWQVRREAAGNRWCPPDILASIAHDPEWDVRRAVARNPNTPATILDELSASDPRLVDEVRFNPAVERASKERKLALLLENLRSPIASTRAGAAASLGRFRTQAARIVPALVELLRRGVSADRLAAIESLRELAATGPGVVEALGAAWSGGDREVAEKAGLLLETIAESASDERDRSASLEVLRSRFPDYGRKIPASCRGGHEVSFPVAFAGTIRSCPECGRKLRVPRLEAGS